MTGAQRLLAVAACMLGLSLGSAPVHAQPNDAALATGLFTDGRKLMKNGDYEGARKKLLESARLDGRVGTFANLGECEERLGHPAAAWADWLEALNLARSRQDERLQLVESEFERIDRTVPKLLLQLPTPTPPSLALSVDDVKLGADATGTPLPVDPGTHTIVAKAPGKKPWTQQVQTTSDGATTPVSMPALEDEPGAEAPVAPSESPREPSGPDTVRHASALSTGAIIALGAGAVGAGVGTYFWLRAVDDKHQAENACGGVYPMCLNSNKPVVEGHQAAGRTDAAISTVAFVASGAALATAAVLFLWPRPAARSADAPLVVPAVGHGEGGVVVRGSW
jgi:hypothetical protein